MRPLLIQYSYLDSVWSNLKNIFFNIVEKSLKDRVHKCICGLIIDRDHNAAINILERGTRSH